MPESKGNVSDDFAKVVEEWRKKHNLRADEPLLLCLELFRIHQEHWDELRRKEMPALPDFHDSLLELQSETDAVQRHIIALMEQLRKHTNSNRFVTPTLGGLVLTALFAVVTGILIGRFIL